MRHNVDTTKKYLLLLDLGVAGPCPTYITAPDFAVLHEDSTAANLASIPTVAPRLSRH
jgi:hypothetical protein